MRYQSDCSNGIPRLDPSHGTFAPPSRNLTASKNADRQEESRSSGVVWHDPSLASPWQSCSWRWVVSSRAETQLKSLGQNTPSLHRKGLQRRQERCSVRCTTVSLLPMTTRHLGRV